MIRAQKEIELAAAEAAAAAVQPEEVSEEEEECAQVPKPLSIPEPIMETTEVTKRTKIRFFFQLKFVL